MRLKRLAEELTEINRRKREDLDRARRELFEQERAEP